MLEVTIWMNYPSFYQCDLFRVLAASAEIDLQVVFARDLTRDRIDLGWQTDLIGYSYRFLDERNPIADAVRLARSQPQRLHVINGLWSEPAFAAALVTLAILKSRYAIYSESPDPGQPRSIIKKLLQRAFGRMFAPRAVGAFSVSHLAVEFYKSLKVRDSEIYPFGYFRSSPQPANNSGYLRDDNRIEVIFVGQLIHRKGIDLLLDAMLPLFNQYPNLFLIAVGRGEMLDRIQQQAAAMGAKDRVVFEGIIASDKIPKRLAAANLLALPSRWDGWGLVVNEAFSAGVPVVVSDRCGAADLVRNGENGYVFRSEDAEDLRNCLSDFLNRKNDWPRFQSNAARTGSRVSVEEVAPYLIECLKHMTGISDKRPLPPWTESDRLEGASRINEDRIYC